MAPNRRRQFLARVAAIPAAAAFSVTAGRGMSAAYAAAGDYANLTDYKALVCIYLEGGCDSHSLFLPAERELFGAYTRARGSLAVKASKVRYVGNGDNRLGFNPALPDLADLYAGQRVAVVRNLGNLAAPVAQEDYYAMRAWVPAGLFSHDAQSQLWNTASSGLIPPRLETGWAGRMADLMHKSNRHEVLPLSYSFLAPSQWLQGVESNALVLNHEGLGLLEYLDSFADNETNRAREATLNQILQLPRTHALKQKAVDSLQQARTASHAMHELMSEEDYVTSSFVAGSSLARSLKTVARMIIERNGFNTQRQVFFIRHPGWDTHVDQSRRLPPLMQDLNASLAGFQRVLEEHNMQDSVTTFTASEFARALSVNTSGTDHGWGGQYVVMGGAVRGGRVVGKAPSYRLNGGDDAGSRGRFIPSVSTSQFGAALASWFGVNADDMHELFPDLRHFANRPALRLFKNS